MAATAPVARDPDTTSHTVTARKAFRCEDDRCGHDVQIGEDYGRHVAFPGAEFYDGPRPWVMRLCMPCTTKYDQPVPPRRNRRRQRGVPRDARTT